MRPERVFLVKRRTRRMREGQVASGKFSPNKPDRVRECLDKGARGFHIEISGIPEVPAEGISVESVKRTGDYQFAACARVKK